MKNGKLRKGLLSILEENQLKIGSKEENSIPNWGIS
jgi:hypothetical protein